MTSKLPAPQTGPTVAEEWAKQRRYDVAHWIESGYSESAASRIANGELPARTLHWPAAPRYRCVELECSGMRTEDAVAKVRKEWAV